jgi:hypothetical protein
MNKIYFNDIYIHIAIMLLLLSYSVLSGIYVLFSDEYNVFLRIFVIFIIAAGAYALFKRDTFLPFLGISFIPNTLLIGQKVPEGANVQYELDMRGHENGTRIIYWAANKTDKIIEDPFAAYKDFHNVGVTNVVNGKAIIKVFCPDQYKVGTMTSFIDNSKQILDKHFHYRIVFKDTGLLSPVMTAKLNC